ncbi:MAG TPA: hypothetical protein VG965_03845 [Patescibacteria group bacterium]|nr:hypothetical protein [Patescibacteria group bacterium]
MKITIGEELASQKTRSVFLVLTGPSGSGKDTVFARLQAELPNVARIVTTTSRNPRPHEEEGNPYYFVDRGEFERRIADHKFFEWVEFRSNLYGTEKKVLEDALASGKDIILHIETKGVKNIKDKVKQMTDRSVFVFLTTTEVKTLEDRVKNDNNGKDKDRWNEPLVHWEMEQYDDCDYLVVNDNGDLDQTIDRIKGIMETKRQEIIRK